MVYLVMSGTTDGSSKRELMETLKKMMKHNRESFPDMQHELITCMTGRTDRIAWVAKFDSMADAETSMSKLSADKGYQELLAKSIATEEKRGRPFWMDGMTVEYWNVEEV